jgi:nitrite reductase (NO-forming)
MPTHAHLMLFGWVGMTIYAGVYRLWPTAAESALARIHAGVAHLALVGLTGGLSLVYAGEIPLGEPIATVSSLALFANMALFGWIVFRATGRDAAAG